MTSELSSAFLLHQRAYRETSVIAQFLTRQGKLVAVCKGVRANSKSARRNRAVLQPFSELAIDWMGKGDLKTLTSFECLATAPPFAQHQLYSAMYLNELLVRLVQSDGGQLDIYDAYGEAIALLASDYCLDENGDKGTQIVLRNFELRLLEALGFAINFERESLSGEKIKADFYYHFDAEQGFIRQNQLDSSVNKQSTFSGNSISSIQRRNFEDVSVLRDAKKLLRLALATHLGDKPLAVRALFQSPSIPH